MSVTFPYDISDLVAVWVDQVEYYGYVYEIDFDLKVLPPMITISVEFFPGVVSHFDFSEVRPVKFPEPRTIK